MKQHTLVNIGYKNFITKEKIVIILQVGSSPVRRLVKEAKDTGKLVDATLGKKTRSVIVTDGGMIILSAILPETIAEKFRDGAQAYEEPVHENEED